LPSPSRLGILPSYVHSLHLVDDNIVKQGLKRGAAVSVDSLDLFPAEQDLEDVAMKDYSGRKYIVLTRKNRLQEPLSAVSSAAASASTPTPTSSMSAVTSYGLQKLTEAEQLMRSFQPQGPLGSLKQISVQQEECKQDYEDRIDREQAEAQAVKLLSAQREECKEAEQPELNAAAASVHEEDENDDESLHADVGLNLDGLDVESPLRRVSKRQCVKPPKLSIELQEFLDGLEKIDEAFCGRIKNLPYKKVWEVGANRNTFLKTIDSIFEKLKPFAGKYQTFYASRLSFRYITGMISFPDYIYSIVQRIALDRRELGIAVLTEKLGKEEYSSRIEHEHDSNKLVEFKQELAGIKNSERALVWNELRALCEVKESNDFIPSSNRQIFIDLLEKLHEDSDIKPQYLTLCII